MNKNLVSIAIATSLLSATTLNVYADDTDAGKDRHKQYIGTGIGATAGALFGGPVGLFVGGVIGNLAGRHDAQDDDTLYPSPDTAQITGDTTPPGPVPAAKSDTLEPMVADHESESLQTASLISTEGNSPDLQEAAIHLTQLEIFFLSGSTDVNTFYQPHIQSISRLLHTTPDLDVHLEGYSDRRGDKETNLELSHARLESVRDQLVQAGVDTNRIRMRAFGEQNFNSAPGDLEAYTFDRRVVIRLQQALSESNRPVALAGDRQAH